MYRFPKDKSMYDNYVCPYCFYTLDKCTCENYPHYSIIWVDKGIQEIIRILNEKGYDTQYCCESHEPMDKIYIMFRGRYGFGETLPMPKGFKYIKSNNMMEYKYGIDNKTRKKMSMEEFETEKHLYLESLLAWAKALPEQPKKTNMFGW